MFGSEEHGSRCRQFFDTIRTASSRQIAKQFRHLQELGIENTARRLVVLSLWWPLRRCTHNGIPGQVMVEIAASRSSVCAAVSWFGLHSYFVSDSCLSPTANRFPSARWIPKTIRDTRDSRMIAGLVTLKHMSAAGLEASLKLITHLQKHKTVDRVCTLAPYLLAHAHCFTSVAVATC